MEIDRRLQVVMACSRRVHQRMADLQRRAPPPVTIPSADGEPVAKRGRAEPTREFDLSRALRDQFH